jgi:hypothetical protein
MRIYATCSLVLAAASSSSSYAFQLAQQRHTVATTTVLDASKCGNYDFDVAIVGCGVGGHGAALHARAQQLETAVFAGGDVGGSKFRLWLFLLLVCVVTILYYIGKTQLLRTHSHTYITQLTSLHVVTSQHQPASIAAVSRARPCWPRVAVFVKCKTNRI